MFKYGIGQSEDFVEATYKVLVIGDAGVGKTALIKRLVNQQFTTNYLTTIGIDFVKKVFEVDGAKIKLEIWDTAGQERFRSITRFQYRGSKGLILVYDITSRSSFEMLNYWMNSIEKEIEQDFRCPIPIFIIGNKCDLEESRQISKTDGQRAADSYLTRGFCETSAKNGINVFEVFYDLAHVLTEIHNPTLMNGYLNPKQKRERRILQNEAFKEHQNKSQGTKQYTHSVTLKSTSKENKFLCCPS